MKCSKGMKMNELQLHMTTGINFINTIMAKKKKGKTQNSAYGMIDL